VAVGTAVAVHAAAVAVRSRGGGRSPADKVITLQARR
jgi:hypothetical protein